MPPRILIAALAGVFAAIPAPAQERVPVPDAADGPPQRMASLIVFGDDACPRSSADEIIVCARLPESERYRLPKRFRGKRADAPAADSWTNRVATLETVSRVGTPNSCSPVGSAGQTGCYSQFLRQARDERREAEHDAAGVP